MVVSKTSKTKVGNFKNKSAINHTVARFETPVRTEFAIMQIAHSLKKKINNNFIRVQINNNVSITELLIYKTVNTILTQLKFK